MASPLEVDEKLFTRGAIDGEYTTWTHLLTRDFGGAANLGVFLINDLGTTLIEDIAAATTNRVDRFNALTTYAVVWSLLAYPIHSATHKYVVDNVFPFVGWSITVLRDGVIHWQRSIVLDEPDANVLVRLTISPSGQYIAVVATSTATANNRYLMVYVGS